MIALAARADAYSTRALPGYAASNLRPPPKRVSLSDRSRQERTRQPDAVVHLIGFDEEDERALRDLLARVSVGTLVHADVDAYVRSDGVDQPGCLIVHAEYSLVGGLEFLARFGRPDADAPVIVVADRPDVRMAVLAMKAGAVDFLEKPCRDHEVLEAVGAAIRIDRDRRNAEKSRLDLGTRFAALTQRERQVMGLVTQGLLNKQVAADLGLSEITVKVHRGAAMRKMGARTLAELVRMADALAGHSADLHRPAIAQLRS